MADQRKLLEQSLISDPPSGIISIKRYINKSHVLLMCCVKLCKPNHDSISNGVNIGATPWNTGIRTDIAQGLVSDPPSGLLRLLRKSSVISIIQRADQRSEISLEVFSDPPPGLPRLLRKKLQYLSNPEDGTEIRDFSGSFL